MLLAVDVGNTNTSLGVFDNEKLKAEVRLTTRREWTRDEVGVLLMQALRLRGIELGEIDDAIVACVVPPALRPFCEALAEYAQKQPLVVGPGVKTGMPVRYDPPKDVGADRIVAAVAAHQRYADGGGIVVVDFGTATTFDVVSPTPEYLGGVIAPGVGVSAEALFARAAKLPRVEIARPSSVVGRNTVAAVQSGLVFGYVSLVEGMLTKIRGEFDWKLRVVGTGGFAKFVAQEAGCFDAVDETLMLEGLRLIHQRNRST